MGVILRFALLAAVAAAAFGVVAAPSPKEQKAARAAARKEAAEKKALAQEGLESFCGFDFDSKINIHELSKPIVDSATGLTGPSTVRLKKEFRVFEDAVLWYRNGRLCSVELTHVMPSGSSVKDAVDELEKVRMVLVRKYGVRFVSTAGGVSCSSRIGPGNNRDTFFNLRCNTVHFELAISGDVWQIPRRASLQTGKDLATDDSIVLTVRATSKRAGHDKPDREPVKRDMDGLGVL